MNRMRTTLLDFPAELVDEARSILGFKSKTDTSFSPSANSCAGVESTN